ncbi:FAM21 [Acanthosepion pharaonis]|uniref:FAM21 n=1 Tax=Acanthosepion pharaonis TaxID=158019 RepID=A0A812ENJ7_ACAPH|nr:FAM21 [Sepia pharaonis]
MNIAAAAAAIGRARAKVAGLDLFDDEEEEEESDPFTKTNNARGSADSEKVNQEKKSPATGLFSEGEDDLFSSAKPKESVKKKPAGGVSLLGEVDIFSKLKKAPERKEEAKKVESAKSPPRQSTLSLFDDDEDEDETDTLFNPLSKPAAGVTPTAPKPETKQRTKSLFEDEDVLFGTPEENPSVDLFSSEGPLAPKKKRASIPAPTKSKVTGAATDLFGDSVTKKSEPKKIDSNQLDSASTIATSRTLNIEGVTEDESADSDITKETKSDAAPPLVKKPIGGVSLFGGADPFAEIMKKKKAAESKKEKEENENPATTLVEKSGEEHQALVKESIPPPKIRKPLRVESEQHDSVNQLPIPRPQPPTSFGTDKLESPGVSFDHPPTPQPLQSATVTKERARILSRRRPQSRRARRAAAGSEFDSTDFSPISPMTAVPYMNEEGTFSPVNPIDAMSAPVLYSGKDPFNYKEILNSKTKPSALSTPTQEDTPPKVSAPLLSKESISKEQETDKAVSSPFEDDLFASAAKKMPSKDTVDDTDDLFGPSSVPTDNKKAKDITATTKTDIEASKTEVSLPKCELAKKDIHNDDDDDDDDIFADATISVNKKKDKKIAIKHDDGGGGDDIFASNSVSTKMLGKDSKNGGLKTAGRKIQNNNVTKDDDLFTDDTDIFANLPATKQKEKKTVTTTKSASKPLFQEDIDDIFADSLPSKKESTVRKDNGAPKKSEKPTSNKISSIFDDDDDDTSLFDDPLSVKSK